MESPEDPSGVGRCDMRFPLGAISLAACLSCACTEVYQAPAAAPDVVVNGAMVAAADVQAKTVALVASKYGEDHVYCSGVWVGPDSILTANHCDPDDDVGTALRYQVKGDVGPSGESFSFGPSRTADIVRRDAAHDLLLLRAHMVPVHAEASVVLFDPYVGEAVQTMGHPMGLWYSYSTGVVSAVRRLDVGDDDIDLSMKWIQSTSPISPGNSGGGLFDANGDLMGVCSRGVMRGQNINLFVGTWAIRAFLSGGK